MTTLLSEVRVDETGELGNAPYTVAEPLNWHVGPVLGAARYSKWARRAKRALDVTAAALLLVLLSPLFLALAIIVRRDSSGPAVFRQTRVGFKEKPFTIWKFRTMTTDNDDGEHRAFVTAMLRGEVDEYTKVPRSGNGEQVFKLVGDPRITRVGAFLRRSSLDELPQLVNVLNGTMSLVGPRPSLDYELVEFSRTERQRAAAMPGMTGLWQVEGRNSMTMSEALALDVRYVESCSLTQDFKILLRTVGLVARGTGH